MCVEHPVLAPRDGDGLPQRLGESITFLVSAVPDGINLEAGEVPMPFLGERGDCPVGGIENQVGGRKTDLQRQAGIAEKNHPEHEHNGSNKAEDAVCCGPNMVFTLLRCEIKLARDFFLALDDQERTIRVLDDDVGERHWSIGDALLQLERPAAADAYQGRDQGEEDGGE